MTQPPGRPADGRPQRGGFASDAAASGAGASAETPDVAPSAQIDWQAALAEHGRWLRSVLAARLGERQAIDDVMQEVAAAAVEQRAPLSDPAKVAPWLYRLAVTQALLYRRRMGRRRKLTEGYAERVRPSDADSRTVDPLAWLVADERRKLVRVALGKLPARDAEILLLKYGEDWSYHEIAARLGIGHSAVEARLHRARRRLRSELAAMNVVDNAT
jgi:RNA polymerase sigma factor (sigma-70 family)